MRDVVHVLCLRPMDRSSYGFTRSDVLDMTVSEALHYYQWIAAQWEREAQAIRAAAKRRR